MPSAQFAPSVGLYALYTLCFIAGSLQLGRERSADVYFATTQRFLDTPLRSSPSVRLLDIRGATQVYGWITEVFVPQAYAEQPMPLDGDAYCTSSSQCLLGEGDVGSHGYCADPLVVGKDNCPSFMGSGTDCCEACLGSSCKNIAVKTSSASLSNSTSVRDISASCADVEQPWLKDLSQYDRGGFSVPDNVEEFTFCPEWLSRVASDIESRTAEIGQPLMLGSYNQVLMGRISMKRASLVPHESKAHTNAYPLQRSALRTSAYSFDSSSENTGSFGGASQMKYSYQQDKGFNGAGGFLQYIDFSQPQGHILNQMTNLKLNHWFDLNQGSLVLDLLMYNGNIDSFLYLAFVFEHDFTGRTEVTVSANPLDLTLHNLDRGSTWFRFGIYLTILCIFCYFTKSEVEDLMTDLYAYFSDFSSVMQLISLVLCFVCMVLFLNICVSYTYLHFTLPLSDEPALGQTQFQDIANLALGMEKFTFVLSVTTFLIVIRCVFVVAGIVPHMVVVVRALDKVKHTLCVCCFMYSMALLGFAFAGFFLFGSNSEDFSTVDSALVSVVTMTLGGASYVRLKDSEPGFAFVYWAAVGVFGMLLQPIMLSALVAGYMKQRDSPQESDTAPLAIVWGVAKAWAGRLGGCMYKYTMPFRQLVFGNAHMGGGGGGGRVNDDLVAALEDRRSTRPRKRKVTYESKQSELQVNISDDVTLKAVEPCFPGGLVQYYVESTKPNGPAYEAKVLPGFRLVEIKRESKTDRGFREPDKVGAPRDPHQMLKSLQNNQRPLVTLVFEGRTSALPLESAGLGIMLAILLSLTLLVSRVPDSYHQYLIHESTLLRARPNPIPEANISFDLVDSMADVQRWVSVSILDGFYMCAGHGAGNQVCGTGDLNSKPRDDWFLWHGLNEQLLADPYKLAEPLLTAPPAAEGLSVGFVPFTVPAAVGGLSVPAAQTVHVQEYNVGVLPNNQVIATFQVPCYQSNPEERWATAYRWILSPDLPDGLKAAELGSTRADRDEAVCSNINGQNGELKGRSGVTYKHADSGGYRNVGGYRAGLGSTRGEAHMVSDILAEDAVLQRRAASVVFEFVTYNGNYDLFMHVAVAFGLGSTGKLEKAATTTAFPLNVFSIGNSDAASAARVWNWLCFFAYIVASLCFALHFFRSLFTQYRISKANFRPAYLVPFDFLAEDFWNLFDFGTAVMNFVLILRVLAFILMDSSFDFQKGVQTWIGEHRFAATIDLNSVDPSVRFGDQAAAYRQVQGSAAICVFLLIARLLRYCRVIPPLMLVSTAISQAFHELFLLVVVLCAVFLAFALMSYLILALDAARFGSIGEAFLRMLELALGDLEQEVHAGGNALFWCIVIPIFQLTMFFILSTMVGSVAYRWKEARRDAEDFPTLQGIAGLLRRAVRIFNARAGAEKRREDATEVSTGVDWWRARSILELLSRMSDSGQLRGPDAVGSPHHARNSSHGAGTAPEGESVTEAEGKPGQDDGDANTDAASHPAFDFGQPEDQKKFVRAFRKLGMEKASELSKADDMENIDDDQVHSNAGADDREGEPDIWFRSIVEKPQPQRSVEAVAAELGSKLGLEGAQPSEEVWLDALVTVLEDAGFLDKVQHIFLPAPTPEPKRHRERVAFANRKRGMENRLDGFLRLLQMEAKKGYYGFLGQMAKQKETVLKQQSLVLTDYLQTLEDQHRKVQEKVKDSEKEFVSFVSS
mmetsp:Transcript_249/g.809  ORF Transcript_249/g.809 Transcript_249/m.809 type:complete len:1700 (-) Transcript_249:20-5119(-)